MDGCSKEELQHQILSFLRDFKDLMGQGRYFIKEHQKNIRTLCNLGITSRLRDELILSLTINDYSSGPHPDLYHPGDYWIFGKRVDDTEIYIKLKIIIYHSGNEKAVCISFHPSEHPLIYPFQR